jgi:hypothetical protein
MQIRIKGVNTVRRYRKDGSFALYRYHRATGRQLVGQPERQSSLKAMPLRKSLLVNAPRGPSVI